MVGICEVTDLQKIKALAEHLTENLGTIELGEMLLTYHVVSQSIRVLIDNNDTEAINVLRGFQQNVFDEIAKRIYTGEISIQDAAEFHDKMMEKYHQLKDTEQFKDIEKSLSNISGKPIDFRADIDKMAADFTTEYNQIFGVKQKKHKKIPTPNQIINGKQKPGLPNN
jgi:hypothetical protein